MLAGGSLTSRRLFHRIGRNITLRRIAIMTRDKKGVYFAEHEVTDQVFLTTPHSFAFVNLKPLLPGHVLVSPLTPHRRLTDLSAPEITDLFQTVQRVQRLLARHYFRASTPKESSRPEDGSFNLAVQDGTEAGQTVSHVHVHVVPRIRDVSAKDGSGEGDELYEMMAREEGNVGGALWDRDVGRKEENGDGLGRRPVPGGSFPRVEDEQRVARGAEEMAEEAGVYKKVLKEMEGEADGERVR